MKKNYYLILLLLIAVFASCKKDESNTRLISGDTKSDSFYKIGTVLKVPDSTLRQNNGSKISYIARFPQIYSPTNANGTGGGALGSYTKANFEIARSNSGLYSIFFQGDGNLVIYKRSSPNGSVIYDNPLWATNALDTSPYTGSDPFNTHIALAQFQDDGNIVCKTANGNIYWTANLTAGPKPIWIMQDDGNFVGYSDVAQSGNGFVIQGRAFGATFTDGGRKSRNFGTIKPTN